jgi:HAMP domain-containing protein
MRRISTKLVLMVLAAVALPFLGFAVYMDQAVTLGFTKRVTQQALLGLSGDLSGRLDRQVAAAREGLELLAGQPFLGYLLESVRQVQEGDAVADPSAFAFKAQLALEERQRVGGLYELMLLVDSRGGYVIAGRTDAHGQLFDAAAMQDLEARDFSGETWFQEAMGGSEVSIDQHKSELFPGPARGGPGDYFIGLAEPIGAEGARPDGVLLALVSWQPFQDLIQSPVVRETFRGLVREGEDPSPYAWVWSADADRILAHKFPSLYGQRIIEDLHLGQMTEAVLADPDGWGMYPAYEFRGVEKTAAFKRCAGPEDGGFGWVVGVGIDDKDMYASANDLRRILRGGTVTVILIVLLWTMVIARRMTSPIHALQELTRRVAGGELDVSLEPTTKDELGALTRDFNAMTARLAEQREQLVKAEKDAAWREMSKQIAHDI